MPAAGSWPKRSTRMPDQGESGHIGTNNSASQTTLRFGAVQRRQLTIMFVDLIGSTEMVASLGPEEARDVFIGFLQTCAARIEASRGFVARFMGDGVLAYFGYPTAHEEDAKFAIHAALEIQQAMAGLPHYAGQPLNARIGIATGEVMIGDIIGRGSAAECMAVGAAANLAARLQSAAAPGGVLVSDATARIAGDAFSLRQTGPLALKGFDKETPGWEVLGSKIAHRFGARIGLGLNNFVGRQGDLARLHTAWRGAAHGCKLLVVTGDAGIGKSRLSNQFRSELGMDAAQWIETSGAGTAAYTPFFGLSQLFTRLLDKAHGTAPPLDRLRLLLRGSGGSPAMVRRLAEATGIPIDSTEPPLTASATQQRDLLVADCAVLLRRAARSRPIVLAIEDAHWFDPSSAELLSRLLPLVADLPLLILATSRTGQESWLDGAEQLCLERLDDAAVHELARQAGSDLNSPAALSRIVSLAQGVPLFAEELARLLAEKPQEEGRPIPETLADLLLERLGTGSHTLTLAQAVAVLGEDSQLALLAELSGLDLAALERTLDQLAIEQVILPSSGDGNAIGFKHALFGEAAYSSMPKMARRTLHLAAARLLVEEHEAGRLVQPDRVARHFQLGGDPARARRWWTLAGNTARLVLAFPAARHGYEQAIALLSSESADQDEALRLHAALLDALQQSIGYSAPDTLEIAACLRKLAEQQGDLDEQLLSATAQWAAASSAGNYELARGHANRVAPIARALAAPNALAVAAMIELTARYRCADLIGAEAAFQAGVPHFTSSDFYNRPGAIAQTYGNGAINAWLLGHDDLVRERLAFLAEADARLTDPYNLAFSRHMASMGWLLLGEARQAEAAAREALNIAEASGFPQYSSIARITLGGALAIENPDSMAIGLMRGGIEMMEGTGSRAAITLYHAWLADAEWRGGDPELALGTATRGLRANPEERYFIPELLRLKAELDGLTGRPERVVPGLRKALDTAHDSKAGGLHRRILASLARHESLVAA